MIKVTIGNDPFDALDKKDRGYLIKLLASAGAVFTLVKMVLDNERAIVKLKKEIKELKSKGE
ncbi:MAG: hypothetical protein IKL08_05865 [Clostridia bacterium]|nr:hypothetical protein [Clostridia bacterium]